jgi:hypothetical protein
MFKMFTLTYECLPGERLEEGDEPLGDVGVEVLEEPRHVGEGRKAVGVEVAVTHLQHVVLNSPVHT